MKKILILTNAVGGLLHFRKELIEKLISLGFEVYFSVPNDEENIHVIDLKKTGAVYNQIKFNRRSRNPVESLLLILEYKRLLKKIKPDLILTYTIKPNTYGTIVASFLKIPVIMNITGLGSSLYKSKVSFIIKFLYKMACERSMHIFFQNIFNLDFFINSKIVDPDKIKLIPGSGVNLNKFKPISKTISDDKIRFLFIGRLMKEKGIEEFFKAAKNVIKKYPDTLFQIIGSIEEEKYNSYFKNTPSIEFLGRSEDVRNQIREADCVINPSYHEGMSNVLQEAAAMGKPLIASNIPGCREIVEDGKNGFLFEVKNAADLENKIIQFIELSVEQKVSMGKFSRQKVEKEFDRKIVVEEYMKAIGNILKKK